MLDTAINLGDFDEFKDHSLIVPIIHKYEMQSRMALSAVTRLTNDLEEINGKYVKQHGRIIFTSIEGRVKTRDSFLYKYYQNCCIYSQKYGISEKMLEKYYKSINDIAGVRFSCPYYDEVEFAIDNLIRPKLNKLGYATNLEGNNLKDRDYLNEGDIDGYRSYHFFLKVPIVIDIYGGTELCICEVQGRSELQHIWAVKSHDLLYKSNYNLESNDNMIHDDMKQLSNSLRVADQSLVSIRNRTKRGSENA